MADDYIFTHSDVWTPCQAPVWHLDEDEDTYMARLGYRLLRRCRNYDIAYHVGNWQLYTAIDEETALYHAAVLVDGTTKDNLIWLPHFPDLMAYMARYGEVGQHPWTHDGDCWNAMMYAIIYGGNAEEHEHPPSGNLR